MQPTTAKKNMLLLLELDFKETGPLLRWLVTGSILNLKIMLELRMSNKAQKERMFKFSFIFINVVNNVHSRKSSALHNNLYYPAVSQLS